MGKKKVDLAPYIIKQSSQDGKLSSEDLGIGLDIYSKYGTVGLSKNKNTQSYEAKSRGMGAAIKGGKFEGVF
jgi:hypothetical protein